MIRSLKSRLLLWLILPLLMVSAFALYDTKNYARITAHSIFDRTLAGSTIAIAERVGVTEDGSLDVDIPYIALDMLTSSAHDRIFYRINFDDNEFLTGYKELVASGEIVNKISYSQNQDILFYNGIFRGEAIRLALYKGVAIGAERRHNFEILLAETTKARDSLTQDILNSATWRLALILATALVFVWVGIVLALKPLTHLQQAIARRTPNDLHPITHKVPLEVESLISTINSFMTRLGNSLSALRNFTGNAEHQIKTPLSIAKANIYLAQQTEEDVEQRRLLNISNNAITQCERILSQLILLSRVENEASSKSKLQFNLVEQVKQNIVREYPIAAQFNIDIGIKNNLNIDEINITGNATLFDEMLHNIISNIFMHADRCTVVTVYLNEDRFYYYLHIEDNGIGIMPENYDKVISRFGQTDASKNKGSGLGLSIVSEIMNLYDGGVKLSPATHKAQKANGQNIGLSVELKFKK
ncbi:MAG: sensor histidine kinase N-terminal domain-containing protein [Rhizobiales bacterium]|nr:sensor histidine kinase N-terminal domain-containing protein [Hyphomicrobiales bacterium]